MKSQGPATVVRSLQLGRRQGPASLAAGWLRESAVGSSIAGMLRCNSESQVAHEGGSGGHTKGRVLLAVAGVSILVLAFSLAAAEAYVRHRERSASTPPGTMPLLYYRHVRLQHALVRDYSYFGWVHTDTAGFRRTDDGSVALDGHPLVLVLGSSTTFDPGVSGDLQAWPARLEAWLRERGKFQGRILNGGVSGYTVVDDLVRLETVLADFQPDVILLYDGHNDLFSTVAGSTAGGGDRHRPWQAPAIAPWTAWLEQHSLLYGKLVGRFKALRFRGTGNARVVRSAAEWNRLLEAGAARFQRNLESLAAVSQARHIPMVWMTITHVSAGDSFPASPAVERNWINTLPGVPPAVTLDGYRRFNGRIAYVAQRYGIPLIDGAASGVVGADLYAEGDPIHFNDRGADRFASFVGETLVPLLPRLQVGHTKGLFRAGSESN
jgi:lysophospholipase L1-like esterase